MFESFKGAEKFEGDCDDLVDGVLESGFVAPQRLVEAGDLADEVEWSGADCVGKVL